MSLQRSTLSILTLVGLLAVLRSGYGQRTLPETNVAEQYLLAAANEERAVLHLLPLERDVALETAARAHAFQMVSHGTISHRFDGELDLAARGAAAGARFSLISENVAESSSAVQIHSAWMHSEAHRHNLLDPNVDSVGIVVIARGRRLFAVEDFERSVAAMSLQQQEDTVAKAITRDGTAVTEGTAAAKRICANDSATERQAAFVMRYTTSQLEKMPEQLRSRLATGGYASAAVAACEGHSDSDFSMYRLAVLLYR